MTWVLIPAALVIIGFIFLKFKSSNGVPILSAYITNNGDFDFNVKFIELRPDVKQIEYLRLCLNFITRVYYISRSPKEDNRSLIRYFLTSILDSENLETGLVKFKKSLNLVENIDNAVDNKVIVATLIYQNIQARNIHTKIPTTWYQDQFFYSILALIFSCLDHLDDYQKELLHSSLKKLAFEYNLKSFTNSLKESYTLPNKVFIESTFRK